MNPFVLSLFRALGLDPVQVQRQGEAMIAYAQSIDARLTLIAKQQELLLAMLTTRPGAPPHPSEDVKRISN